LYFQPISLDNGRNPLPGLLGAVSVKLNAIAKHLSTIRDGLKRRPVANTRVDRRRGSIWELEESANPMGFGKWYRVEAQTAFALKAHWNLLSLKSLYGHHVDAQGRGREDSLGGEWMYTRSHWKAKM